MKDKTIIRKIIEYTLLGLLVGGSTLGSIRYNDYKEKKALDAIKSHSKTIEYSVKPNEGWEQIGRRFVPKELRNRMDSRILSEYLAKELNGKNNYNLQEYEIVKIPLYEKN